MEFALICVTNYTGNVWLLDDSQGWPKYYIQIERRILLRAQAFIETR